MKCFAPQTSTPGPSQGQAPVRPDPYHGMANHRGTQAIGLHTSQQTQCTASAYHSLAWAQDSQMDYVHSSSSAGSVCMTCRGAVCTTCRGAVCRIAHCGSRRMQGTVGGWWPMQRDLVCRGPGLGPQLGAGGWGQATPRQSAVQGVTCITPCICPCWHAGVWQQCNWMGPALGQGVQLSRRLQHIIDACSIGV